MNYDSVSQTLSWIFGGDYPDHTLTIYQSAARAMIVYVLGLIFIRIGRNRLLGNITIMDGLLAIILGSVLSRAVNGSAAMTTTLSATGMIFVLHWCFTKWGARSHKIGRWMKGRPILLIEGGVINRPNLQRCHFSELDLIEQVRLASNLGEIAEVEQAYLERNGQVSVVFKRSKVK